MHRVWALLAVFAMAAGCLQADGFTHEPPLDDRGELREDIAAPPPEEDGYAPADYVEAPGDEPFTVRGRVLGSDGRPVPDAEVWIEGTDLREPVDNLAFYLATRAETLVRTAPDGSFRFRLDEGFYSILADAPLHMPYRTVPQEVHAGTTVVDIVLRPRVDPAIIAHRGASFYAPENTLAAIDKAALLGADLVEVDVRLTVDGHLVLIHDPTVDRTTDGHGVVANMTLLELRTLDAGSWFDPSFRGQRVPTLHEATDRARELGVRLLVDVKAEPWNRHETWVAAAGALAREGGDHEFGAFRAAAIRICASAQLACVLLSNNATRTTVAADARSMGAGTVAVEQEMVGDPLMERALAAGVRVYTFTLNDEDAWDRALVYGVDGIVTDRPGYLLEHLNRRHAGRV